MPRKTQDTAQYGPRIGDDPETGHWAAAFYGFAGAAGLAHGFDCLASEAGMADGLSFLLKTCGITIRDVDTAEAWQLREWYYRCYAEYSGETVAGAWDVVATGSGIYSFNSGWCPPAPRH